MSHLPRFLHLMCISTDELKELPMDARLDRFSMPTAGRALIALHPATPAALDEIVDEMALWQEEGAPAQLHPGDLGWAWRFGAQKLADEVRVWRREGRILAVGMVDAKDGLIRMAIAPSVDEDEAFAAQLLADLSDPRRVVLRGTAARDEAQPEESEDRALSGRTRGGHWGAQVPRFTCRWMSPRRPRPGRLDVAPSVVQSMRSSRRIVITSTPGLVGREVAGP